MRPVRWVVSLALLGLVACAPAAPVTVPEPTPAPEAQIRAQTHAFETLMGELYGHFMLSGAPPTEYISPDATPAQGAAELREVIDLGDQAHRFALATATELSRQAAARTLGEQVSEVELEIRDVEILGEHDGELIVATTIWQQLTSRRGPIHEETVTYAVGWRGQELASVGALIMDGNQRGLDAGVGLSSPLGAAGRFVELVEDRDLEAIAALSGGANDDEIALDVLASVVQSSESTYAVTLPQHTEGSTYVVYLTNASDMVIGRFKVDLADPTQVVYHPTA